MKKGSFLLELSLARSVNFQSQEAMVLPPEAVDLSVKAMADPLHAVEKEKSGTGADPFTVALIDPLKKHPYWFLTVTLYVPVEVRGKLEALDPVDQRKVFKGSAPLIKVILFPEQTDTSGPNEALSAKESTETLIGVEVKEQLRESATVKE